MERNQPSLTGRAAIVTGAGRGLGRAEALELARHGAAVVVNDFDPAGAEQSAADIVKDGGQAVASSGDVSDFLYAESLTKLAIDTFGALDILVNNAGILRDRMVFSMTEQEWDDVLRVHAKGHFALTRHATAHWREQSKASGGPVYGRIVNTSSEAFLAGAAGQANYAAAKAAIVGLTTATANGCARYGVRANAICPRARTKMTEDVFAGFEAPAEGMDPLAVEHVAPLVAYLVSPAADKVNGQVFVVHGGMVILMRRPVVEERWDSEQETFTVAELETALGPYFDAKIPHENFSATDVLSMRRP
ncbi:3-oxoacyl-ACP reductase [Catenulispora sp. NF23]|uniref:3-oxoacyl-ACP reductase n=1 Tax=Catenulispora pinistramenti TaxID=2705254 RepID=A0ABS5KRT9_9ACTN|nr:3-oxoacyl-ACP reductase [Catenulispora pinistramenti]MBS2537332.1 3-oxoacyl-ACP reductase [Catenulispora pinistramenti]MBS2548710.1 3-oxoacyl-ACP reductase [Catenulispora pinistramenti]